MVDTKSAWVDFPGYDGFKVEVATLARQELIALRKKCMTTQFDRRTRQPNEILDEKKFVRLFAAATVKNWSGLKFKYLESFIPVNLNGVDPEDELAYSPEEAELLVENSADFDNWLNEVVFDLDNFRSGSKD